MGHVSDREMFRTFNMGLGFLIVCPRSIVPRVRHRLPDAKIVGIVTGNRNVTVHKDGKEVEIESY
jgi:phosphoribosylaminoimidazole (AIR) synthetase